MTEDKVYTIFKTENCRESYKEWMKDQIDDESNWPVVCDYQGLADHEQMSWEDEIDNLDIEVGTIVKVASLGLWDGRRSGYKITDETSIGKAIAGHSWCGDYIHLYVEGDRLMAEDSHHDGTNVVEFRVLTAENLSYDDLYETAWSVEELMKVTRPLGPDVKKIFGWE